MKPIKKKTAKFLTIVISIILLLGLFLTFVPFKIGSIKFNSFAGNIKIANDIKPGLYGEYVFSENPTSDDLSKGIENIKSILGQYGYQNATVYGVGEDKLRVEVAVNNANDFAEAEKVLAMVSVGVFELRTSTDENTTFINGHKDISDVKIGNSGGKTYIQIIFNSDSVAKYKAKMIAGNTIYVYLGGTSVTSFSAGGTSYDDLYLTFEEYEAANQFRMDVLFGSLVPLSFDNNLTEVNTMSATLSNVGLTADINSQNYGNSDALVITCLALTLFVLLCLAYLIIKFKIMGAVVFASLCGQTVLICLFMQAFDLIEISLATLFVFAVGYMAMIYSTLIYVQKIYQEIKDGKSLLASVDGGYKKSMAINIVISALMLVVGAMLLILNSGSLAVGGLMLIIFAGANALGSLLFLPFFIKLVMIISNEKAKLFGLALEEDTNEKVEA